MNLKFNLLFLILMTFRINVSAQEFSKGIAYSVTPLLVNVNNFNPIKTESNTVEFSFDKENPYTYIVLVSNQNKDTYQILYQTNIWGDLSYLALSNIIYQYFDCPQKLDFLFFTCIKKAKVSVLKSTLIDEQINCIIEKLNRCN